MPILDRPAVVTRATFRPLEPMQYLLVDQAGPAAWTPDPAAATAFASMREATRAASRLPSALRAFGVPLPGNNSVH